MARNLGKITSDLKKAAQRIEKIQRLPWSKPVVKPYIRTARDKPLPKGFSISKMLRATPEAVRESAVKGDVRVIRQQKRVRGGNLGYWFMTTTSEKGLARQHEQTLKVKDKADKLYKSQDLYYECTCPYFKFYCDWAMHRKGASELKHSTNEPPDEKNPRYTVYPCKHLMVVCQHVEQERI